MSQSAGTRASSGLQATMGIIAARNPLAHKFWLPCRVLGQGPCFLPGLRFCHVLCPPAMLNSILRFYMKIIQRPAPPLTYAEWSFLLFPFLLGIFLSVCFRIFSASGRLYSRKVVILGSWEAGNACPFDVLLRVTALRAAFWKCPVCHGAFTVDSESLKLPICH